MVTSAVEVEVQVFADATATRPAAIAKEECILMRGLD